MADTNHSPPRADLDSLGLDLGILTINIEIDTKSAEPKLFPRDTPRNQNKRRFWGQLAKHIDLSGANSSLAHVPAPFRLIRQLEQLGSLWESSESRFRERLEGWNTLLGNAADQPRQLNQPMETYSAMQAKTAQFFLRNVPRLERHVEIWRSNSVTAIWREDDDGYFDQVRYPRRKPPELLETWSVEQFRELAKERYDNIHGFNWEEKPEDFRQPKTRKAHTALMRPKQRISVHDLTLDPAPANRPSMEQIHVQTLKALSTRYDGSK